MSQLLFGGQIQPLQSGLELQEALVIGDSGQSAVEKEKGCQQEEESRQEEVQGGICTGTTS